MEDGNLLEGEDYHTLVDPQRWIPGPVQELTGITPEDVRGRPRIEDVVHEIEKVIGNSHLMAHNAKFDKRFLDWEFSSAGIPLVDDRKLIDTPEISRTLYRRDEMHKLNVCVERERVKIGNEGFRSADFDVRRDGEGVREYDGEGGKSLINTTNSIFLFKRIHKLLDHK